MIFIGTILTVIYFFIVCIFWVYLHENYYLSRKTSGLLSLVWPISIPMLGLASITSQVEKKKNSKRKQPNITSLLLIFWELVCCIIIVVGVIGCLCYFMLGCARTPLPDSYVDRYGNSWCQCEDVDFPRDWYVTVKGKQYCFKEKIK